MKRIILFITIIMLCFSYNALAANNKNKEAYLKQRDLRNKMQAEMFMLEQNKTKVAAECNSLKLMPEKNKKVCIESKTMQIKADIQLLKKNPNKYFTKKEKLGKK